MRNKILIVLGALLIFSAISELIRGVPKVANKTGIFFGAFTVILLGYYLIRRGMGKKGFFDR
jgi:hypothetical protein